MLLEAIPFEKIWKVLHSGSLKGTGVISFVRFLEKRLGANVLYDTAHIPFGMSHLIDLLEIAETLKKHGVIRRYGPWRGFCDEPRFKRWTVESATEDGHMTGGMAASDDRAALTAALAEAMERYIWFEKNDYFKDSRRMTTGAISLEGSVLLPEHFAGFSEKQRATDRRLVLRPDAEYLWIRGFSHTQNRALWVPAQVVSWLYGAKEAKTNDEPLILSPITTGLATGPTHESAILNGALEIIERDAFMITWLNQLTPPRIDLADLASKSQTLSKLLGMCSRYQLSVEVALLPTDAPAYAVCGIVTDESAEGPAVTIGLKAHRNLAHSAEGAILEALRIRETVRNRRGRAEQTKEKDKEELNHLERIDYWDVKMRRAKLNFLTSGTISQLHREWEHDSEKEHFARIVAWCRASSYEFASADLGVSCANVSPWHIHMVLIPELQPMHQNETLPYIGGSRLKDIPKKFGYAPRTTPFMEEPHPFA